MWGIGDGFQGQAGNFGSTNETSIRISQATVIFDNVKNLSSFPKGYILTVIQAKGIVK